MSDQRASFNEWSLAMGNDDGSFSKQFNTLTKYQHYMHITNEVTILSNRELSESRRKLSQMIRNKGNRSSSLFWTEGRGKPEDQGIRILKNSQGSYMSDPPSILKFVWCYFDKLF